MKRCFITVAVLLSVATFSDAQTGTWSGKLDVQGSKLSLVFHLDEENPTMDSPDQGVKGIPIQVTRTDNGNITIKVPAIGVSYEGLWTNGQIEGTFKQLGASLPLTLLPGAEKLNRPQTPKAPFPYAQGRGIFQQRKCGSKRHIGIAEWMVSQNTRPHHGHWQRLPEQGRGDI
ncbi:MAG: hypothetical protein L6V92_04055 [Phocaeicola vulgatus]|nr:MAG: hypothetical protein L6V92_04055 [Phocaeicola vulgatus]